MAMEKGPPSPWEEGGGLAPQNLRLIARIAVAVAALVLVILALYVAKGIYTDWLWFDGMGFLSVFTKILVMRVWLFFAGALLAVALLLVNLYIAYRFSRGESTLALPQEVFKLARIGIIGGVALIVFIMSVVFGGRGPGAVGDLLGVLQPCPLWHRGRSVP